MIIWFYCFLFCFIFIASEFILDKCCIISLPFLYFPEQKMEGIFKYIKKWQFPLPQMLQMWKNLRRFNIHVHSPPGSGSSNWKVKLKNMGMQIWNKNIVLQWFMHDKRHIFLFHFFSVSCCDCFCFVCYFLNLVFLFEFSLVLWQKL